jgi:hypothetical protein
MKTRFDDMDVDDLLRLALQTPKAIFKTQLLWEALLRLHPDLFRDLLDKGKRGRPKKNGMHDGEGFVLAVMQKISEQTGVTKARTLARAALDSGLCSHATEGRDHSTAVERYALLWRKREKKSADFSMRDKPGKLP